ncbi:MAG: tetratricopeptide repeat protein [Bdellovibrionales bacterium]
MYLLIISVLTFIISCTPNSNNSNNSSPNQAPKTTLSLLQEKIKTAPSYENFISLGIEYSAINNNLAAISSYETARNINPKAPLAWNNLCAEYNKQNKFAIAQKNCKKAIELEPQFQLAKNNLKFATDSLEKTKKFLAQKKSEITSKKNMALAELVDLGLGFYNIDEFKTAADLWLKIKKNEPNDVGNNFFAMAQNNLATVYILLKDFSKAEKHLEQALEIQPKNQLFLNNKKWLSDSRKQTPQ